MILSILSIISKKHVFWETKIKKIWNSEAVIRDYYLNIESKTVAKTSFPSVGIGIESLISDPSP